MLAVFVMGGLLASGATASEALVRAIPDSDFILVVGTLDPGFTDRLRIASDAHPEALAVEIESLGGNILQSKRAAALLNDRGLSLRVRGRCASACALLWAATKRRVIINSGSIGLHSARPGTSPPALLAPIVRRWNDQLYTEPLRGAGFSEALIARARSTPSTSMFWLSPEELLAEGVVFQHVLQGSGVGT